MNEIENPFSMRAAGRKGKVNNPPRDTTLARTSSLKGGSPSLAIELPVPNPPKSKLIESKPR